VNNILEELKQRLQGAKEEKEKIERRADELSGIVNALQLIISDETKRFQFVSAPEVNPPKLINKCYDGQEGYASNSRRKHHVGSTELGKFIFNNLTGVARSLHELVNVANAENIDFHGKKPGRVLHQALLGLRHNGYTEYPEPTLWRLTPKGIEERKILMSEDPVNQATGVIDSSAVRTER
jgi:hypothetical protein